MKIEFPFTYPVHFKMPGKARWSSAVISDTLSFDLIELEEWEAPVVATVRDESEGRRESSRNFDSRDLCNKFKVPTGECVVRKLGDQFYASRFAVEDIAKFRGDPIFDQFSAAFQITPGSYERDTDTDDVPDRRGMPSTEFDKSGVAFREFERKTGPVKRLTSDRAVYEDGNRDHLKRFAVVEGVVYEMVHEPVITVVAGHQGDVSVFIDEAHSPKTSPYFKGIGHGAPTDRYRFGLDEYFAAMDWVEAKLAEGNRKLSQKAEVLSVETEAFGFRGEHERLFVTAASLIGVLSETAKYLDGNVGLAAQEAGNVFMLHNRLTPTALRSLRRLASALEEADVLEKGLVANGAVSAWDFNYQTKGFRAKAAAFFEALERWDARPRDGREWLEEAVDALPVYEYPLRAYEVTSNHDVRGRTMAWHGKVPKGLGAFDRSAERMVVVEHMESGRTVGAAFFDRFDPEMPPKVFAAARMDEQKVVDLADAFLAQDRRAAVSQLAGRLGGLEPRM